MMTGLWNAEANSSEGSFNQSLSPIKWADFALIGSLFATSHILESLNFVPEIDMKNLIGG